MTMDPKISSSPLPQQSSPIEIGGHGQKTAIASDQVQIQQAMPEAVQDQLKTDSARPVRAPTSGLLEKMGQTKVFAFLGSVFSGIAAKVKSLFPHQYSRLPTAESPRTATVAKHALDPTLQLESDERTELTGTKPQQPQVQPNDKKLGWSKSRPPQTFEEKWTVGGKPVATETIEILPTRDLAKTSIEKRISDLKDSIVDGTLEKAVIERQINTLECMRSTLDGREQQSLHGTGTRETAVSRDISTFAFAEVPNFVRHEVVVDNGPPISLIQFGAMADQRNTKVSLKQLTQAARGEEPALKKIEETVRDLKSRLAREKPKPTVKQKEVLQHMIDELEPKGFSEVTDPTTRKQHLAGTLVERREILQQQMLLLVGTQVAEAAKDNDLGSTMHLSHTSLLNPIVDKFEGESGLSHCELNMMEDMEQIFQDFDGREIALDSTSGPYIDKEGQIHLPRPVDKNGKPVESESVRLQTHYANVAVFKSPGAKGAADQLEIDKKAINDMDDAIKNLNIASNITPIQAEKIARAEKLLAKAKAGLRTGTASYDVATPLIEAQKLLGWRVSTGCYTNKDRGGVTGRKVLNEMVMHDMEARAAEEETSAKTAEPTDKKAHEERASSLRSVARGLIPNSYQSFRADSVQMRLVNWTVKVKQRALKAWPGLHVVLSQSFPTMAAHLGRQVLDQIATIRSRGPSD